MKHCPNCRTQYTDDTLRFCLQDGSLLQAFAASQTSDQPGETPTVVSGRASAEIPYAPVTNPTNWTPPPAADAKRSGVSMATFAVFATVFVMLLLFAGVGIGAWIWLYGTNPDTNANGLLAKRTPDSDVASNTATVPVRPTSVATPEPSRYVNANLPAKSDGAQISKDVAARIGVWKSAIESNDLDGFMGNYAPTVDYFNRKGLGVSAVRADKARAFEKFDSMTVKIGPINVVPDASGENATAVFDKEWYFRGATTSSGRVQTELKLKKIGGKWLITGESDRKVYWTK